MILDGEWCYIDSHSSVSDDIDNDPSSIKQRKKTGWFIVVYQ